MKVIDFLMTVNENKNVTLISDTTGEVLSLYDGKNSIDEVYNDWFIAFIDSTSTGDFVLTICE